MAMRQPKMPMPDGNASRVDPFQQPGRQGMAPGTVENLLTDRDLSNIAKAHPPDPLPRLHRPPRCSLKPSGTSSPRIRVSRQGTPPRLPSGQGHDITHPRLQAAVLWSEAWEKDPKGLPRQPVCDILVHEVTEPHQDQRCVGVFRHLPAPPQKCGEPERLLP